MSMPPKKPSSDDARRPILKTLLALSAVLVAILFKLVQPVPFRHVTVDELGRFVDASPEAEGARILLGTSSHLLPLVRVVNYLGEPFKRSLVPFDVDAMREEAIERIGHEDFGDIADWEAFDRLVEVADEKCHLFGRISMQGMFKKILATNLKVQKVLKENPEIEEEVIERPVIMAAFTRTGATFLYQVLADVFAEELTPTYSYEIFGGPIELDDPPTREREAEVSLNALGAINPPMKLLHEWVSADTPEDEPGWFQHTLTGLVIPFSIPSGWHHSRIYETVSQGRNRQFWETINKIKQHRAGRKLRFLMKAPEHLFGFAELHDAYPDGSFITVSRDEKSWYESALVITHLFQQMFVDANVNDTIAFTDTLNCGQRRALEIAHNGSHNVLSIEFGSYLFTQTYHVVDQIAAHADLAWGEENKARARDVIARRLSWKGKSVYNLEEFGLTKEGIAKRLDTVCEEITVTS